MNTRRSIDRSTTDQIVRLNFGSESYNECGRLSLQLNYSPMAHRTFCIKLRHAVAVGSARLPGEARRSNGIRVLPDTQVGLRKDRHVAVVFSLA
jgi:hypothetical protein